MSDFDPDAHLDSSEEGAFDPDAHLDSKPIQQHHSNAMGGEESGFDRTMSYVKNYGRKLYGALRENEDAMDRASPLDRSVIGQTAGVGEAALSQLTGALSAPVALAITGQQRLVDPMGIAPDHLSVDDIRNAITYQPRSAMGKALTRTAGAALSPIGDLIHTTAKGVSRATGASPDEVQAGLETGLLLSPLAKGKPNPVESAQDILDRAALNSKQSMGASAAAPRLAEASPDLQHAIVSEARANGGAINADVALRHLEADSLPVKMKLTEGQAMQDPVKISEEMNRRGKEPALAQRFNEQNAQLTQNIQALRDQVGPEVFSTNAVEHGDTLINAYKEFDKPIVDDIHAKYEALKEANGGEFPIDGQLFVKNTEAALRKELKSGSVPADLQAALNEFKNGRQMTFEDFETLRSDAADAMRTSSDGRARAAANIIRQQLENMPLTAGAAKLKPLADAARSAAKARFDMLEKDPAYKAAVTDSVVPDKFVSKFVLGAPRDQVALMRENLGANESATQTLSVAAIDHLRDQALGTQGNFSSAAYTKALKGLDPKLRSLVDAKTAEQLETLGNVARYTQAQPKGSFVNNSNTLVGALAEHGKSALEGAANVAAHGIPVGTWMRKAAEKRSETKATVQSLKPGAGIRNLKELAKSKPGASS